MLFAVHQPTSPFCLGYQGRFRSEPFQITAELVWEWSAGRWTEWYVHFALENRWLAFAQGRYFLSSERPGAVAPDAATLRVGRRYPMLGTDYVLVDDHEATLGSIEGQVPWALTTGYRARICDFSSGTSRFACVEYAEHTATVFAGEVVQEGDFQ
jgi:hypothetical protein